jgi:serine/threonine protein kinase
MITRPAMDVWAAGCVIIEMASANTPWAEKKFENEFQALFHIGNSGERPPIPSSLSSQGQLFLARAFVIDEKLRPSVEELLRDPWFDSIPKNILFLIV